MSVVLFGWDSHYQKNRKEVNHLGAHYFSHCHCPPYNLNMFTSDLMCTQMEEFMHKPFVALLTKTIHGWCILSWMEVLNFCWGALFHQLLAKKSYFLQGTNRSRETIRPMWSLCRVSFESIWVIPNRKLPIVLTNFCPEIYRKNWVSKDAISFRFNLGWYIDNDRFCGQFVGIWLCQSIGTCGGTGIFCLEPRMKSMRKITKSMTLAPEGR